MGYTAVWKVLEEMLIELRKKELPIPPSIMEDLKTAKTVRSEERRVGKESVTPGANGGDSAESIAENQGSQPNDQIGRAHV